MTMTCWRCGGKIENYPVSLRDHLAAQALNALVVNIESPVTSGYGNLAAEAYAIADAMMAECEASSPQSDE